MLYILAPLDPPYKPQDSLRAEHQHQPDHQPEGQAGHHPDQTQGEHGPDVQEGVDDAGQADDGGDFSPSLLQSFLYPLTQGKQAGGVSVFLLQTGGHGVYGCAAHFGRRGVIGIDHRVTGLLCALVHTIHRFTYYLNW